jgi:hypothetical protein
VIITHLECILFYNCLFTRGRTYCTCIEIWKEGFPGINLREKRPVGTDMYGTGSRRAEPRNTFFTLDDYHI